MFIKKTIYIYFDGYSYNVLKRNYGGQGNRDMKFSYHPMPDLKLQKT